MEMNLMILLAATAVPLVVGFVWYNPRVLGTAWMKASGVTPESAKGANMAVVFGLTILFSFMIALIMQSAVIHQFSVWGLLTQQPDYATEGSLARTLLDQIMSSPYWGTYRTFKHGAFHGTLTGIFLALPVLGINSLFERKGFKYVAINGGYWIISLALMGGLICAYT